jgi:hypothetical protein
VADVVEEWLSVLQALALRLPDAAGEFDPDTE